MTHAIPAAREKADRIESADKVTITLQRGPELASTLAKRTGIGPHPRPPGGAPPPRMPAHAPEKGGQV